MYNQLNYFKNESDAIIIHKNKNTSKKAIADCMVSFFVSFDFGGFLTYINKSVPNQKIAKISQPTKKAKIKSSFIG